MLSGGTDDSWIHDLRAWQLVESGIDNLRQSVRAVRRGGHVGKLAVEI